MATPNSHFAGRTNNTNKGRRGISRGVKRLLSMISHARTKSKSKSRPNTLTLFDMVSLASAKNPRRLSSRLSICVEPSLSAAHHSIPKYPVYPGQVRKRPSMADRIVDVRLESIYEEENLTGQYTFAAALQDVWHAQDIEAHSRLVGSLTYLTRCR